MSIRVIDVTKQFGAFKALDRVSLEVPTGSLCALLGPSGSGKTTLLRILAGLEIPDAGQIVAHGADVTNHQARERDMGFVFQHYALFRHMTVFDNVAFPLRVRSWPKAKSKARVEELLHLVRLEDLAHRFPSQLSGGQRQRVALVRALAAQPKVLLLDEPFGALDAKVRQELRQWLRRFHQNLGVTTILVTHDQEEAFELSDQVVVLRQGKIEQNGAPQDIFDHPASPFVMDFLGHVNIFHGRFDKGQVFLGSPEESGTATPEAMALYVRPHELDLERAPSPGSLAAQVHHINPAGPLTRVHLLANDTKLPVLVELSRERWKELALQLEETVYVVPRNARFFPAGDYVI